MKLPLSWIKEIINIDLDLKEIDHLLTQSGLEVDACYPLKLGFEGVVVGKVTDVKKHPQADSLNIATVTDGKETYQVVCGAPNCRPGIKTAFGKVGAKLGDQKIKKAKLRGVESFGMLLSEKELGLSEDHIGIIELDEKVGKDLSSIFGDTIFEISLTPNLGHAASVLGVARELKAQTGQEIVFPDTKIDKEDTQENKTSVKIEDFEKCPRYCCRVIKDVEIKDSPAWLQRRLIASGFRPVNNVVDVTNYVLLEMGHPLHAFDLDQLAGVEIIVRKAKDKEIFVTLDDKKRELTSDDLLICDSEKPVAIAGVMGGLNSEVSGKTKNILLEAAYFEPIGIRKTSKRLTLQTESSRRFEKGIDPNNIINCLDRAAKLIQEVSGGRVLKGAVDVKKGDFPKISIPCRLSRINKILDTKLKLNEVEKIFSLLEMEFKKESEDLLTVFPPTYRVDCDSEIDLVEEVARIVGFDKIPKRQVRFISSIIDHDPMFLFENEIRNELITEGLQEFLTCDLIGPKLINKVKESISPPDASVAILNPTSVEQSILRTSFLPGLLNVVKYNMDHQISDVSGFEIGFTHFKEGDQYKELPKAAIVLCGKANPDHFDQKAEDVDFFDLKGILENLFTGIGIDTFSVKNESLPIFHPGRQAKIFNEDLELGIFGEVHPSILRRFDISKRVYFAEIDLINILDKRKLREKMDEIPIYPASTRDLTITVDVDLPVQNIFDAINSIGSKLLEKATLVDVYQSEALGKGIKNVTFHFIYRHRAKTIDQEMVEKEHKKIVSQIESCICRR